MKLFILLFSFCFNLFSMDLSDHELGSTLITDGPLVSKLICAQRKRAFCTEMYYFHAEFVIGADAKLIARKINKIGPAPFPYGTIKRELQELYKDLGTETVIEVGQEFSTIHSNLVSKFEFNTVITMDKDFFLNLHNVLMNNSQEIDESAMSEEELEVFKHVVTTFENFFTNKLAPYLERVIVQ